MQCVAVCCNVSQCLMTLPCVCAISAVSTMVGVGRALAACCSVLQCVAVWCSVVQCVMTWVCAGAMVGVRKASPAPAVAHTKAAVEVVTRCVCRVVCCSGLQCVVVGCSVLERKQMPKRQWRWFSGVYVLQCVAMCCSVLWCVGQLIPKRKWRWLPGVYVLLSVLLPCDLGYQVCMSCRVF